MATKLDILDDATNFYSGPAEFLVAKLAEQIADVTQFENVFGTNIDAYMRQDYSIRELPALRIYNTTQNKESETGYLHGDIVLDVIMPPAIRRPYLQQYQDTIVAALIQQFRRPSFFSSMLTEVPGLNELGKEFRVDKTMGFQWQDEMVPVTQITLNFRLLLNDWDTYLTSDDRTKDDPFEKTLGDLELLHTYIRAMRDDDETIELTIEAEQDLTD